MKMHEYKGDKERDILIGMMVNNSVLSRISAKWDHNLFQNRYANIIGGLCVTYYQKYNKAPKKAVISLFSEWAESINDETTIQLGETFLRSVTDEWNLNGELNVEYVADLAGNHFNSIRAQRLSEQIEMELEKGHVDKAMAHITNFNKIEMGPGAKDAPFNDQSFRDIFSNQQSRKKLITFPSKPMDHFFQNELLDDSLLSFCGPQKSGKSFWLQDIAYLAMTQRRPVAYFQIGDMSRITVLERLAVRANRHPLLSNHRSKWKWPCIVKYPIGITAGKEYADVETEDREFSAPLSLEKIERTNARLTKKIIKSKRQYFVMSCHSNLSISITGIKSILEGWDREGWRPDIVVIDYADNLAPVDKREEPRHQVNTTWKLMRALALDFHVCVVTGTQVNAGGFKAKILTRSNFSEDNRKLNHVTGMVGINVSPKEKESGLSRLNWIVKRTGDFNPYHCLHVAGCLDVCNPAILSLY